jgi:hypothetical protein
MSLEVFRRKPNFLQALHSKILRHHKIKVRLKFPKFINLLTNKKKSHGVQMIILQRLMGIYYIREVMGQSTAYLILMHLLLERKKIISFPNLG